MAPLSVRALILPRAKFGGLGRLLKTALSALDVFAEAQAMAEEAQRFRYGRG